MCMNVSERKRNNSATFSFRKRRSVNSDIFLFFELCKRVHGKFLFMIPDIFHPKFFKIGKCCAKTNCASNVRSSCFKFPGKITKTCFLLSNAAHHAATKKERGHFFEQCTLAVQNTNPCWSKHFVAGKAEEVTIKILHINRHVRHALRAVNTQ